MIDYIDRKCSTDEMVPQEFINNIMEVWEMRQLKQVELDLKNSASTPSDKIKKDIKRTHAAAVTQVIAEMRAPLDIAFSETEDESPENY